MFYALACPGLNHCLHFLEACNKSTRYNLKVAVKTRDIECLPKAIADFKGAKLPDDEKDLEKGERILWEHEA